MVVEFILIFPVIYFFLMFAVTYGIAAYAKGAVEAGAREAAREYAVTHDEEKARIVGAKFVAGALGLEANDDEINRYAERHMKLEKVDVGGDTYCRAVADFHINLPVILPNLGGGTFVKRGVTVYGSAMFREEPAQLPVEQGEEGGGS